MWRHYVHRTSFCGLSRVTRYWNVLSVSATVNMWNEWNLFRNVHNSSYCRLLLKYPVTLWVVKWLDVTVTQHVTLPSWRQWTVHTLMAWHGLPQMKHLVNTSRHLLITCSTYHIYAPFTVLTTLYIQTVRLYVQVLPHLLKCLFSNKQKYGVNSALENFPFRQPIAAQQSIFIGSTHIYV
jgi:hypothetical protein